MTPCHACRRIHPADAVRAADRFTGAVTTRYRARYTGVPLTQPVRIMDDPTPAVVDLVGALRASIEAARARREARS